MKNNLPFKVIAILLFSLCLHKNIYSQTPTGAYTVLQQPCNNDGELAVNITSGLTPPLTFTYYSTNNETFVHSNLSSLNDTLYGISNPIQFVTVTNPNYTDTAYLQILMNAPFQIDNPIRTHAVCPSLTGTAQLTINGGATPASVKWYHTGNNGQGAYIGNGNPINLSQGTYSALVIDGNGCQTETTNDIIINNISNITYSVTTTAASCTNGAATVTNPSGGVAPYTYQWSNGANTPSVSNLILGYYDVKVTDAQGCYAIRNTYIQQSINIIVNTTPTAATCLQNDGSAISFGSGGTPPYTYVYSNGVAGQTANGLSGETYIYVTATDANGCIGSGGAYISTSTPINVTFTTTNSSCTSPTGSATLSIGGGSVPYTVKWETSPVQNGLSINNMPEGVYGFSISDAAGCIRTGAVNIQPQSSITAFAYSSNAICPATTGNVNVSVSGSNPPFTYLWNTGATTSSILGAPLGNYTCVITDNVGCSRTKDTYLSSSSPINIGLSSTPASCIYTNDGSAYANATGGTAPYTYNWSNGQTGVNATALAPGCHNVFVRDVNGCTQGGYTFLDYNSANNNCYCTITGKVYNDLNNNCQFDLGEQGIERIMIHCAGFGYSFTNANGDYSFKVPTGNYTLSESVQNAYPLASCQNNSIAVSVTAASNCVSTVNFANTITPIHDIHIIATSINNAIPGNTYTQGLIVQNDGTVSESTIVLGKKHDGQLSYMNTTPSLYTQPSSVLAPTWYIVTSGFPTLSAGASTMMYTDYSVPTNIPLGTDVNFWDTAAYAAPMSNWLNDYTPWNNVINYTATIIGSYDPNFKEVSPKGSDIYGYITTSDSVLDYVIHFQNTGSYYAQKVVVIDTLDTDLDWSSLRAGYSDHRYEASISENGILKFTFNNINLDWQAHSELGSRGLVSYSIKQQKNLSPGTTIKNSAAIYFDYNSPVITNQTLNTIELPMGIEMTKSNDNISIYPNPATTEININLNAENNLSSINIYDLQGRLLQNEKGVNNSALYKVNISSLVNGLYLIELVKTDGSKTTIKFMKS